MPLGRSSPNDSEQEAENIVNESLMEIVNQVCNSEGFSASNVGDHFHADDEFPTSSQFSNKVLLLACFVYSLLLKMKVLTFVGR